ncbi:MAG TPA: glycosyltransferase [Mycobacteriales bacterium]|jgi:tetratricopeptide (TPR) repeat protein|nr:glycosyltransferase [Mycobacteriales bacterium]
MTVNISLCLIVKDETAFLEGCLDSVRGLVDETVIVDTGSTDGTQELARARADVYGEVDFDGDFSAARNAALARASGSWVLFLDADERLPPEQHEPLRRFLEDAGPQVLAGRLLRYNFFSTGGFYTGRELKVFRRLPEIRYQRRVNESVSASIEELGGQVAAAPVVMNHVGHGRPVEARDAKAGRYLALMAEQMRERGPDPVLVAYRGLIERTLGHFGDALDQTAEALRIGADLPVVWLFRGHVLRSVGDRAGALDAYEEGLRRAPGNAALHNMAGVAMLELGRAEPAALAFDRARQLDPQLLHTDINLGLVAQSEGRWDEAVERYLAAGGANRAFWADAWEGRVERDPYRAFYNETVLGYAGLGYHAGYCLLRSAGGSMTDAAAALRGLAGAGVPARP